MRRRKKKPSQQRGPDLRINHRIRVPEVQLINAEGENIGTVRTSEALGQAEEAGLDLVEVSPTAKPPVCRIIDYGKYAYERTRKERVARKQQKKIEIKTIRLSIDTDEFHRTIKIKNAKKWLAADKKVKVMIRFFGREVTRPEIGREIMNEIEEELKELAVVEQRPAMEGRTMTMMLNPEGVEANAS